jgi:hypothetical protein
MNSWGIFRSLVNQRSRPQENLNYQDSLEFWEKTSRLFNVTNFARMPKKPVKATNIWNWLRLTVKFNLLRILTKNFIKEFTIKIPRLNLILLIILIFNEIKIKCHIKVRFHLTTTSFWQRILKVDRIFEEAAIGFSILNSQNSRKISNNELTLAIYQNCTA